MPRVKSDLPGGPRIADLALLGVLCEHVPAGQVKLAVAACAKQSVRDRSLPAEMVVLYTVALCLYREVAYEEVLRCILEGWRWLDLPAPDVATKGAITQARQRLGPEALKLLFENLAVPMARPETKGGRYRSWLTVAVDGTTLQVPDSKLNAEAFGYAGSEDQSQYPLIRCALLAETGTHAALGAAMGPYAESELSLARKLIPGLKEGMLLLADRRYPGFELWEECLASGAQLLWRVSASWALEPHKSLEDGSWLSTMNPPSSAKKPRTVRVVSYRLEGSDETYRLITSILDPKEAPAVELAELYTERWEVESCFDEIKTHLKGARTLLRSKDPKLVEQEFWALLIAHRALRSLMHEAALAHNKDPDKVSFVGAIRIVKRTLPSRAVFSPQRLEAWREQILEELVKACNANSRGRSNPRAAKRRINNKYGAVPKPRPPSTTRKRYITLN